MLFREELPRRMAFPDGIKDQQQHILTLPKQNKRHLIHPSHDPAPSRPMWPFPTSGLATCSIPTSNGSHLTPHVSPPKHDLGFLEKGYPPIWEPVNGWLRTRICSYTWDATVTGWENWFCTCTDVPSWRRLPSTLVRLHPFAVFPSMSFHNININMSI